VRKLFILLVLAPAPVHCAFAQTQDPPQVSGSQSTSKSSSQTSQAGSNAQLQQSAGADSPAQPLSVAELARMARAKKQQPDSNSDSSANPAAKPHKIVLDDDNMPRGVYAPDASARGAVGVASPTGAAGAGSGSAGAAGPFPEYRGKVVLVDFWASWCGPCRNALPNLKRLQSVYGGDDFVVVSVSEDDDENDWRSFTANHQMTWPQQFDSNGNIQRQFGVNGLPTYVLIGRDGNMIGKYEGEDPARSILERIGPQLKQALATTIKQS
jgi:thiol-disulfide isomerase/thioredoxin